MQVLLNNISEQIPTNAVIFDVSTDRGIRTGNQTLTEIMYRLFLQSLGYARDLDLSELEITLQEEVLNFIEYLLFKIEHEATRQEASDWSTLSLTHAMRGMEDEDAPPYTLEDLQEQFS